MAVRRWSANRSYAQQEVSREVDGQYADFFLYVFPGGTSHNVTQEVQRVVYTTTTAEGDSCTPGNFPLRLIIMCMMTETECGPNPHGTDDEVMRHAKQIASHAHLI